MIKLGNDYFEITAGELLDKKQSISQLHITDTENFPNIYQPGYGGKAENTTLEIGVTSLMRYSDYARPGAYFFVGMDFYIIDEMMHLSTTGLAMSEYWAGKYAAEYPNRPRDAHFFDLFVAGCQF